MSAALIVCADDVVKLILGAQWKEVGNILRVLSLAMFLKTSAKFLYSFLKAHGSSSWLFVVQVVYLCLIAFAAFVGSTIGLIPLSFFIITAIFVYWVILFLYVSSLCKDKVFWGGFIPDYAIFFCWMLVCYTLAFYLMFSFRDIISLKIIFVSFLGLGWCYFLKSWFMIAKTFLK
jgi:O-antigen/teichoic acid export membrane protein